MCRIEKHLSPTPAGTTYNYLCYYYHFQVNCCLYFFSIINFFFQVTDMMLQEKLYPSWAKFARKWWNTGVNRIILFWFIVCISSFIVIFVIATDYINWDSLNRDFLHTNELSRAFLASFILVLDITIVMQVGGFAGGSFIQGVPTVLLHFPEAIVGGPLDSLT